MSWTCPRCGEEAVPLLWGLPVQEAHAAARDGRLALGGCLEPLDPPNWQCANLHRWRDPDQDAWQDELLAVLGAYGYVED